MKHISSKLRLVSTAALSCILYTPQTTRLIFMEHTSCQSFPIAYKWESVYCCLWSTLLCSPLSHLYFMSNFSWISAFLHFHPTAWKCSSQLCFELAFAWLSGFSFMTLVPKFFGGVSRMSSHNILNMHLSQHLLYSRKITS